jgi:hypothetical protein
MYVLAARVALRGERGEEPGQDGRRDRQRARQDLKPPETPVAGVQVEQPVSLYRHGYQCSRSK